MAQARGITDPFGAAGDGTEVFTVGRSSSGRSAPSKKAACWRGSQRLTAACHGASLATSQRYGRPGETALGIAVAFRRRDRPVATAVHEGVAETDHAEQRGLKSFFSSTPRAFGIFRGRRHDFHPGRMPREKQCI